MTKEEYLSNLFKTFTIVKTLASKPEGKVLQVRHKTNKNNMVVRCYNAQINAYKSILPIKIKNLPLIYDVVDLEDGQIILEEFIDGLTVAEIMETGLYRYRGAKVIISSVCNALEILHEKRIIHRDVKPENVIIDKNGRVVLIDLNVSRTLSSATKDTIAMGTIGYASPEQMGLAQSDTRTDIYALGVLLNVMLTGQHPTSAIANGRAKKIINKCTHINPEYRYKSVKALSVAL